MPEIRLTPEELRYIALFQDVTGAVVKDCIIDNENNMIIFIVRKGDVGAAIGKGGSNIKKLRKIFGKDIEIVEDGSSIEELAKNAVAPARVKGIKVIEGPNKKVVYISVEPSDKGIAIGKNGKNVTRAKLILKRYFDITNVVIV
ncbi:MAG: NusA-like transcription termination signal-binding factor [Fervidicoccaceae archaeon]|jgi:N utilization substance protein A|uniref:Probable transcription termination protein NusA n=1 Tax=Fervidicoccus fontis TaxID=683846 RepID=A0A7C2Z4E5_9CREN|nr:MAG: NusA-like transcription termination signal-binding factor [Fervidicoccus sp.]HEU98041.1 NusA-like transcription termination signal-binding factor [Fervidicoccus fontis]